MAEYKTIRIKPDTLDRLHKTKHDLYKESIDEAINALIDEHEEKK